MTDYSSEDESFSDEDVQARRLQGQQALVERAAMSYLDINIKLHFGHDQGVAIIRWLQVGGMKPSFDFVECKVWLLSDECTRDIGQGIEFSASADEQDRWIQETRGRYSELVQLL